MTDVYLSEARYQATQDMAAALCRAVADVATLHGNDPAMPSIVAAGFAMALNRLGGHVDSGIPHTVRELLK